MKLLRATLIFVWTTTLWGDATHPDFPDLGIVSPDTDSFYDSTIDYSNFSARVTDKDNSGSIIKLQAETGNVKYFRTGDFVRFRISTIDQFFCEGHVRDVEDNYFVIYVKDFNECWPPGKYFRRGTALIFDSQVLAKRIRDASIYRLVLMKRREDFLRQLNNKNHFIWNFDSIRLQRASDFDKQIIEIQKAKQKALDAMVSEKSEAIRLQKELIQKIDETSQDLDFYRVERQELFTDRWHLDQDLGLPVQKRPQETKTLPSKEVHRWQRANFQ